MTNISIYILFLEIVFLHALTFPSAWESSLTKMRISQGDIEQMILLLDGRLRTRANVHMQEYQKTTHATLRMIVLIGSVLCCWGTALREVWGVERRKGKDVMKVSTLPEGLVMF